MKEGMTTEDFKRLKPEYKDIEGNELWDAMTNYMLQLQNGQEVLNTMKPFWKRYQLRWLFYVKKRNMIFGKNGYTASKICYYCRKGVSMYMGFISFAENGESTYSASCPYCNERLRQVENTNLNHKLYKLYKWLTKGLVRLVEFTHIVKWDIEGRYGIFGDESMFVKSTHYDNDWNYLKTVYKKRRWWEYIFIPRKARVKL